MKKIILFCAAAALLLSACNTFQGMGEDLQGAGNGISNAAQKTKDKINGQ